MTQHEPVRIADLKKGDRFTFGPPANVVYELDSIGAEKFRFHKPDGTPGVSYTAPLYGAKVYRV